MIIILKKDYEFAPGRIMPKGAKVKVHSTKARELVDQGIARWEWEKEEVLIKKSKK
jgi:hypothetical protein